MTARWLSRGALAYSGDDRGSGMDDQGQRYLQAKAIVAGLDGLDAAERARAIEVACNGDSDLHEEVRWMLEALTPTIGPARPHRQAAREVDAGETLVTAGGGAYRIVRKLGAATASRSR